MMTHYMIELALWIGAIFLIGCIIGYLLHRMFGSTEQEMTKPVPEATSEPVATPSLAAGKTSPTSAAPAGEAELTQQILAKPLTVVPPGAGRMERPRGLERPRDGKPDPLQRINGIGPKNEKILHTLGFFHFDQIASWTGEQIAWVDDHLKFNGRIGREEWIAQARLLADGAEEEFESRYGKKK
jgi:predicted flap endonuclease-1-like 5' DNA nuclease